MRTAGQGQAAAPRERDARRRRKGLPGPPTWAVGEHPPDCHESWSAINSPPRLRAAGLVHTGRFHGKRPFSSVIRSYGIRAQKEREQ